MNVTASAVSLNVADVPAAAEFAKAHFGFVESMAHGDFMVSLTREDVGYELIFLKTGLGTFKPVHLAGSAGEGLLLAFVVDDIDAEYARVQSEGVPVMTPIETEPWGERYFQVADPNGVIYQLLQWVTPLQPEGHS